MRTKKTYSEKLRDPRWQKKRLEIMQRDQFMCTHCGNDKITLNVHHLSYHGEPWDTPNDLLITLCEPCHKFESERRPNAEKKLLKILSELMFDARDIETLADGFEKYSHMHIPGVMAVSIANALSDKKQVSAMVDKYFLNAGKDKNLGWDEPFKDL